LDTVGLRADNYSKAYREGLRRVLLEEELKKAGR